MHFAFALPASLFTSPSSLPGTALQGRFLTFKQFMQQALPLLAEARGCEENEVRRRMGAAAECVHVNPHRLQLALAFSLWTTSSRPTELC